MKKPVLATVVAFSSLVILDPVSSFPVPAVISSCRQEVGSRVAFLAASSSQDDNDNESPELENELGGDNQNNNENSTETPPPLPQANYIMTAMEQSFREKEMEFLAELRDGDVAIHKFRLLWYSERGPQVEENMRQAWRNMGHPDLWPKAEASLLQIIQEDPTYLFPFVLLSKLYCLQGRFSQSQTICEHVLKLKPYHFSVIETMVANCAAQKNTLQLQIWSSKRLPNPTQAEQRLEWVERALEDATRLLREAKQSNLPKSSGSDEGIIGNNIDSTDTWQ